MRTIVACRAKACSAGKFGTFRNGDGAVLFKTRRSARLEPDSPVRLEVTAFAGLATIVPQLRLGTRQKMQVSPDELQ